MQTCVAALRLPGRMSVERVAGCWWTGWPDGVECAIKVVRTSFARSLNSTKRTRLWTASLFRKW